MSNSNHGVLKEFPLWLRTHRRGIALVGAAAVSRPLEIAAANIVEIAHPERLLLFGFIVWMAGVTMMWILGRLNVSSRTSILVPFVLVVTFSRGSLIIRLFEPLIGWMVLCSGVFVLSALIRRIRTESVASAVLVGVAVFLLSGSLVGLYQSIRGWGENVVTPSSIDVAQLPQRTPDIFLVVVDGYGGIVAAQNDFGIERPTWVEGLEQRGFEVPVSSWSSYPTTTVSVPSLLEMSYPLVAGTRITPSTTSALYDIVGGDNAITRTVASWGYHTTMIESGWGGSVCGHQIDTCVPSALLDEAMFFTLSQTVLSRHVVDRYGYAFTAGTQRTMTWLLENAASIAGDDKPDVVFAHVMAPHAPFFLDGQCHVRFTPKGTGVEFRFPGVSEQVRDPLYLEQAWCIDSFMLRLATLIPKDSVVVFIADHGTNRRSQQNQHPSDWDTNEIVERFNILLAVRSTDCELGDEILIPSVFRRILGCITDTEINEPSPAMFMYGTDSDIVKVDRQVLEQVLQSAEK